jgi:hypothetical protein
MDISEVVKITELAQENKVLMRSKEERQLFYMIKSAAECGETFIYFDLNTHQWNQDDFIKYMGKDGKGYGLILLSHSGKMSQWKIWWHHKMKGSTTGYTED